MKQEIYKKNLEHFVAPKSKKVLNQIQKWQGYVTGTQEPTRCILHGQGWNSLSNKIK